MNEQGPLAPSVSPDQGRETWGQLGPRETPHFRQREPDRPALHCPNQACPCTQQKLQGICLSISGISCVLSFSSFFSLLSIFPTEVILAKWPSLIEDVIWKKCVWGGTTQTKQQIHAPISDDGVHTEGVPPRERPRLAAAPSKLPFCFVFFNPWPCKC